MLAIFKSPLQHDIKIHYNMLYIFIELLQTFYKSNKLLIAVVLPQLSWFNINPITAVKSPVFTVLSSSQNYALLWCHGISIYFVSLVGGQNLIHPVTELSDTGVHTRNAGVTTAASPGHDSPDITLLTHQRTARVTLNRQQDKRVRENIREGVRMKQESYHAGGGISSTCTNRHIMDVASPVALTVLVWQQRQSNLLKLIRCEQSYTERERIKKQLQNMLGIANICTIPFRSLGSVK